MSEKHNHSSDLRGIGKLVIEAVIGITDMAEAAHLYFLKGTAEVAGPLHKPLTGVTTLVYRQIRKITHLAGSGIDTLLNWLTPVLINNQGWTGRDAVVAVLNGVMGDHLQETNNPIAIEMTLRYRGQPIPADRQEMMTLMPQLNGRIVVLLHGLCMSDLLWTRNEHDHGAALERDCGLTPIYLRYNSGLHISSNARQLAELLDTLVGNWPVPVEEIVLLGFSMGGMLARSAFYYGSQAHLQWPGLVSKFVFLGTPHHGAPLERGGHWFHLLLRNNAYLAPFADLGRVRSAGITDLRYGNLLDQDWEGLDRFEHTGDVRVAVPLPKSATCYALAVALGKRSTEMHNRLLGDGLVPVNSALGIHQNAHLNLKFKPENRVTLRGLNHIDLLSSSEVYQQIRKWLSDQA